MFGGLPPGSTRPRPWLSMGGFPQQPSGTVPPQQSSGGMGGMGGPQAGNNALDMLSGLNNRFNGMFGGGRQPQQPYQSYVERMGGMPGLSGILQKGAPTMQRDPATAMKNPYWETRQAPPTDWQKQMTEMTAQIQALRNAPQQQQQQPGPQDWMRGLINQGS